MAGNRISWQPPRLAIAGGGTVPVRTVWCVGRNYAEHAREMGLDPERSSPVFFSKPPQAVVQTANVAYPQDTSDFHHEVELVVFLRAGGRNMTLDQARAAVFGFAVGVDLTRRDVQTRAKQAGQPWEMSKGFDQSAPVGMLVSASDWQPSSGSVIRLSVDAQRRQDGRLGDMLWSVEELLRELSRSVTLGAGDVVFTGTPSGVSALIPGQQVQASINGLPDLVFTVSAEIASDPGGDRGPS